MSDTQPLSGADLLARIKPTLREEATQICLRPDLLDKWEDANTALAELQASEAAGSARLGTGVSSAVKRAAEAVREVEQEIESSSITFRFRAMSKDQYRALCDRHAPRKGNELDQFTGYDRDAVSDALVRECLYDPVFDDASWAAFLEVCNPSEWAELRNTAQSANRGSVDLPKSSLASAVLDRPGGSSARRKPGA